MEKEIRKPTAFYTGGGIWIAAMYTDDKHYCSIDNDWCDECLVFFCTDGEDGEFACQNMVGIKQFWDLTYDEREIFYELKQELNAAMFGWK